MIRLSAQVQLVPGETLTEKHQIALRLGLDGIELQGSPMTELAAAAIAERVPVSAMCAGFRGWFIDPDEAAVAACITDVKRLLELGAELDAPLIIVPIYGRTHFLPPHCGTGRTPEQDEQLWLDGLAEVTEHAQRVGGRLLIEPINRYQNGISVTVADAARFAEWAGSANVRPMADVFHMNIEETSIPGVLEQAARKLGYVHLSDSNRLEPGAGHIDFEAVFRALVAGGYEGWASLECKLSGDPAATLERSVGMLRQALATAVARHAGDA